MLVRARASTLCHLLINRLRGRKCVCLCLGVRVYAFAFRACRFVHVAKRCLPFFSAFLLFSYNLATCLTP